MVELLGRTDPERRRFLVVEGTTGAVLAAGLLQRYAGTDDLDDIGAADELFDE